MLFRVLRDACAVQRVVQRVVPCAAPCAVRVASRCLTPGLTLAIFALREPRWPLVALFFWVLVRGDER